jgi:hypothetical protein
VAGAHHGRVVTTAMRSPIRPATQGRRVVLRASARGDSSSKHTVGADRIKMRQPSTGQMGVLGRPGAPGGQPPSAPDQGPLTAGGWWCRTPPNGTAAVLGGVRGQPGACRTPTSARGIRKPGRRPCRAGRGGQGDDRLPGRTVTRPCQAPRRVSVMVELTLLAGFSRRRFSLPSDTSAKRPPLCRAPAA